VNKLYFGDNLDILREHIEAESVDLIYLDPSYNSNRGPRRIPLVIALIFFTVSFAGKTAAATVENHSVLHRFDTISSPVPTPLYIEIARMDSLLFHAFNTRDIEKFKQYFDTNLEVYQDNIGVRNYSESMVAFASIFKKNYVLTRSLVAGSMEVYPIKDYGAIQTGLHTFSHLENGEPQSATFKFMHIWQRKDDRWKITRLITYDH